MVLVLVGDKMKIVDIKITSENFDLILANKINYVIPLEEVKVEEGDIIRLIVNYYEFKNDELISGLFLAKCVDKTFSKYIITLRKVKLVEC